MLKRISLGLAVLAVFLLHQDCWNWMKALPLVLGFLPVGLAYHAGYAILAAFMMTLLVKFAWPTELERIERELDTKKERNPSE
jgi:hypothetical protein